MSDSLPVSQFNRRSFLLGAGATIVTQGLLGCASSPSALQVLFLKNSISAQLISRFKKEITSENQPDFRAESQLKTIFKLFVLPNDFFTILLILWPNLWTFSLRK
jgi:hypothetical protein